MSRVPAITGLGLVTPLGSGVGETWSALMDGRYITTHSRCPLDAKSPDRVHHLAIAAAREALADAQWTRDLPRSLQGSLSGSRPVLGPVHFERPARAGAGSPEAPITALVVGTSKGAVDAWLTAPPVESFLGSVASAVRAKCPLLDGPVLTLSAACASGLHALIRGAMMIRCGEADRVLVVAAEASVHPLFLGSFQRLGVLPHEGVGCRPFDEDRDGFLMSEAAAAICLESLEPTEPDENRLAARLARHDGSARDCAGVYARLDRHALCGDATHMTASDPLAAALRRLLRHVVDSRPVDLIHAHGTGTIHHDPLELSAFEAECVIKDSNRPAVYSHKGALGHSLGASGLVSIVLNSLMHRHGVIPANVQTRRPLSTQRVAITRQCVTRRISRSLAVASGFGGSLGAVSLSFP